MKEIMKKVYCWESMPDMAQHIDDIFEEYKDMPINGLLIVSVKYHEDKEEIKDG